MALTKEDLLEVLRDHERHLEKSIESAVEVLDQKIDSVGQRVTELRDQVNRQNGRVGTSEQNLARLDQRVSHAETQLLEHPLRRREDLVKSEDVTVSIGGALVRSLFKPQSLGWLIAACLVALKLLSKAQGLLEAGAQK